MFEVGWTEMLVIAIVMIVVVGPKDLPRMLRTIGRTTAKLRAMAGDFQKQFNEALQEAELDDVKKSVDALRGLNPAAEIRKQLNPFEKAAQDVRAGLNSLNNPAPPAQPAAAEAHPAEPLKTGPAALPEAATMAAAPVAAAPSSPVAAAPGAPAPKTPKPAAKVSAPKAAAAKAPSAQTAAKTTAAKTKTANTAAKPRKSAGKSA